MATAGSQTCSASDWTCCAEDLPARAPGAPSAHDARDHDAGRHPRLRRWVPDARRALPAGRRPRPAARRLPAAPHPRRGYRPRADADAHELAGPHHTALRHRARPGHPAGLAHEHAGRGSGQADRAGRGQVDAARRHHVRAIVELNDPTAVDTHDVGGLAAAARHGGRPGPPGGGVRGGPHAAPRPPRRSPAWAWCPLAPPPAARRRRATRRAQRHPPSATMPDSGRRCARTRLSFR